MKQASFRPDVGKAQFFYHEMARNVKTMLRYFDHGVPAYLIMLDKDVTHLRQK